MKLGVVFLAGPRSPGDGWKRKSPRAVRDFGFLALPARLCGRHLSPRAVPAQGAQSISCFLWMPRKIKEGELPAWCTPCPAVLIVPVRPPKPIWAGEVGPPGSPPGLPWGANPRLEAGAAGWGHGGLGARWVPCSGTRWEVSGDCPHSLLGCDDELVINFSPWMRSVRGVPAHRGTPLVCGDRGGPVLRGQGTVPQAQGKCGRRRAAEDSGAVDALGGSVIGAGCWGAPRGAAPCSLRQPRPAARRGRRYLWLPVNKLPMKES